MHDLRIRISCVSMPRGPILATYYMAISSPRQSVVQNCVYVCVVAWTCNPGSEFHADHAKVSFFLSSNPSMHYDI